MADEQAKLQIIIEAVNQTGSPFQSLNASLEAFQRSATELTKNVQEAFRSLSSSASESATSIESSVNTEQTTFSEMARTASEDMRTVNSEMNSLRNNMEKGIGQIGGLIAIQQLGQSMEELGKKGEHLFDFAIEQGGDFEQSMKNIQTVIASNITTHESWNQKLKDSTGLTDQLQQKALDLGSRGAQSANEVGAAMDTMLRAGVDAHTVLNGAAESAQNVAIVTGDKLDESANLVTEIYHQFREAFAQNGKSVQENMKETGDVLTGTLLSAKISSQDFLDTLKYVGPVASQLGSSFTDTATATALLAQNGIKGSQAGNNLKRAMTSLLEPTKQGAEAMQALGLIQHGHNMLIDESTGKMKNLTDIQEILHHSMEGLTEAKKAQYIHDMFGQYALAGTLVLANENSEAFSTLKDRIAGVSAENAASNMLNTFSGHMAQLQAHVQTVAKEFGMAFLPVLEKLIPIGQQFLSWLQSLSPATKEIAMIVLGLGSALAIAGGALASFAISLKFAGDGISALKNLSALTLNIVKTGIEAGVTAVKMTVEFTGSLIKAGTESLILGAKLTASAIASIIKTGAEATVAGAKMAAEFTANVIKAGIEAVATGAKLTASLISSVVTLGIESVTTAAKITGQMITSLVSFTAQGLTAAASVAGTTAKLIAQGAAFLASKAAMAAATIAQGAMTAAQWALNVAMEANPIGIVIMALTALGVAIYETVTHFDQIKAKLGEIWGDITTWFGNLVHDAENWGGNVIHMMAQGISNAAGAVWDAVKNVAGSITHWLGFHSPSAGLPDSDQWAPNFVKMFAGGLEAGAGQVGQAAQALIQPLSDVFSNGSGTASDPLAGINNQQDLDRAKIALNAIVDAKAQYTTAMKNNDQAAMDSAHQMADKYRQQLQQMGVDTKNFSADTTMQQTMTNMNLFVVQATDKIKQQFQQMTTDATTNLTQWNTDTTLNTTAMTDTWTQTTDSITSVTSKMRDSLILAFKTIESASTTAFSHIGNSAVQTASQVVAAVNQIRAALASIPSSGISASVTSSSTIGFGTMPSMPIMAPVITGGGGSINSGVHIGQINVTGNIARNEEELTKIVSRGILNQMKLQGGLG